MSIWAESGDPRGSSRPSKQYTFGRTAPPARPLLADSESTGNDVNHEDAHAGRTGIRVSLYCLGTMMFGVVGNRDQDDYVRIIHRALDSGINVIDTADVYSYSESAEIVGTALKGRRDDIVLATNLDPPRDHEAVGHLIFDGSFRASWEGQDARWAAVAPRAGSGPFFVEAGKSWAGSNGRSDGTVF